MTKALEQKLGSLNGGEQKVTKSLATITQKASNQQLKKAIESFNEKTFSRVSTLGTVAGVLGITLQPQDNPAVSGVIQEFEQNTSDPGVTTDMYIATSVQKLLSILLTDYSFAANIAYEQKAPAQVINPLIKLYEELQNLSQEVSTITTELFKQAGGGSSGKESASQSSQQPRDKQQQEKQQQTQSSDEKSQNQESQQQKQNEKQSGLLFDAKKKVGDTTKKVTKKIKAAV